MKRRSAFTIVEVSIAMVIGIFLLLGVWALYRTGYRSFRKVDANLEAVLSASIVTTVISDDLRNLTLTRDDLKPGAGKHSLPFQIEDRAGQLVGKVTNAQPVMLSKGPFKILITDPEGALKTPPEMKVIEVEYSLEKTTISGKDIYQFARKAKGEKRVYRECYCKEVAFTLLHTKEDPKDVKEPAAGDEQVVYARVTVVGASTSLMEGPNGSPDANSDWYQIPVVSLFALDCISELMTGRGLGRFWRPVELQNP